MTNADDPRVKKLLSFKSLTREDLAVLVVTGTDRGDQLEAERDEEKARSERYRAAWERLVSEEADCTDQPAPEEEES